MEDWRVTAPLEGQRVWHLHPRPSELGRVYTIVAFTGGQALLSYPRRGGRLGLVALPLAELVALDRSAGGRGS